MILRRILREATGAGFASADAEGAREGPAIGAPSSGDLGRCVEGCGGSLVPLVVREGWRRVEADGREEASREVTTAGGGSDKTGGEATVGVVGAEEVPRAEEGLVVVAAGVGSAPCSTRHR